MQNKESNARNESFSVKALAFAVRCKTSEFDMFVYQYLRQLSSRNSNFCLMDTA